MIRNELSYKNDYGHITKDFIMIQISDGDSPLFGFLKKSVVIIGDILESMDEDWDAETS